MTRIVPRVVANRESANVALNVRTFCLSNPGSTPCSATSDRTRSIAAITNAFATATSVTNNTFLVRVWRGPGPDRTEDRKSASTFARDANSAGAIPNTTAIVKDSAAVNETTDESMSDDDGASDGFIGLNLGFG